MDITKNKAVYWRKYDSCTFMMITAKMFILFFFFRQWSLVELCISPCVILEKWSQYHSQVTWLSRNGSRLIEIQVVYVWGISEKHCWCTGAFIRTEKTNTCCWGVWNSLRERCESWLWPWGRQVRIEKWTGSEMIAVLLHWDLTLFHSFCSINPFAWGKLNVFSSFAIKSINVIFCIIIKKGFKFYLWYCTQCCWYCISLWAWSHVS